MEQAASVLAFMLIALTTGDGMLAPSRWSVSRSPSIPRNTHGAKRRAAESGISLAGYVRRLVAEDLGRPEDTPADPSVIFDLEPPLI